MSSKKAKTKSTKPAKKAASAKPAAKPSTTPAVSAPEVKTATKPAIKTVRSKGRGVRYDASKKQEVIDFVATYNQKNGRGGQSAAARKFGVTILTVSSWLKGSGTKSAKAPKATKAASAAKASKTPKMSGPLTGKVKSLLELGDRIRKIEAELRKLQDQYGSLSASIRSEI